MPDQQVLIYCHLHVRLVLVRCWVKGTGAEHLPFLGKLPVRKGGDPEYVTFKEGLEACIDKMLLTGFSLVSMC